MGSRRGRTQPVLSTLAPLSSSHPAAGRYPSLAAYIRPVSPYPADGAAGEGGGGGAGTKLQLTGAVVAQRGQAHARSTARWTEVSRNGKPSAF